jgi:hypothetical protein
MSCEQNVTAVFSYDVGRRFPSTRLHGVTYCDVINCVKLPVKTWPALYATRSVAVGSASSCLHPHFVTVTTKSSCSVISLLFAILPSFLCFLLFQPFFVTAFLDFFISLFSYRSIYFFCHLFMSVPLLLIFLLFLFFLQILSLFLLILFFVCNLPSLFVVSLFVYVLIVSFIVYILFNYPIFISGFLSLFFSVCFATHFRHARTHTHTCTIRCLQSPVPISQHNLPQTHNSCITASCL